MKKYTAISETSQPREYPKRYALREVASERAAKIWAARKGYNNVHLLDAATDTIDDFECIRGRWRSPDPFFGEWRVAFYKFIANEARYEALTAAEIIDWVK